MDPVVSVIVPVFNAAPYLREALESLINQSYRNLEKEHKQFCGVVGPINNPVVVIPYNQIVVSCK